jgi:transposase
MIYAGLDVSLEKTSVCVVNAEGRVTAETKVDSDPEAIGRALVSMAGSFERIGLEAGPLSQWIYFGLIGQGLPAVCVETRHMKAAMAAMNNKTDRNDAHGIAQMMRTGWFKRVHVKSTLSQELRTLLTSRRFVVNKLRDVENEIRGALRPHGLKVGRVSPRSYDGRVRELIADKPQLRFAFEPLLRLRQALLAEYGVLHRQLLRTVKGDEVCRRLMTIPGVGPVAALAFKTTIDHPERFKRSADVAPSLGLVPRKYQSGETDRTGRITKAGDELARGALYTAAHVLLSRPVRWSALKAWGLRVAKRSSLKVAKVAVARKLAVIMHRMWVDQTDFRWSTAG